MFQTNATSSRADVDNYMSSVQSLSALADNNTVTSLPLSAGTQFQCVQPTANYQEQSAVHGQCVDGLYRPAYWQYNGAPQSTWNVDGYAGSGYDWQRYHSSNARHRLQQYGNGFGWSTEHRGWSGRYHPYAVPSYGAAAATTGLVGVSSSSTMTSRYVDQRAPAYTAQSYYHSPDGATYDFNHQTTYSARQPPYVAYQTDYVNSSYSNYQLTSPDNHANDC